MPSLRDVQQAVCRSIFAGEDIDMAAGIVADGLAPGERLSVYRNTVIGALTAALRLSYPAVDRLVGREFFDEAARRFVAQAPPRSAFLTGYGGEFGDFLGVLPSARPLAYLADVARLEWAVNRALHAQDGAPLDLAALAAVDIAGHGRVRFVAHPSVSLLRADHPADRIWRAVLDGDEAAMAAVDLGAGPVWLLAYRGTESVEVVRLDEPAWRFTSQLCAGTPLDEAVAASPVTDPAALLASHLARGVFTGFSIGAAAQPSPPESSP